MVSHAGELGFGPRETKFQDEALVVDRAIMITSRGQNWPQAFHENLVPASSVSDLESAAVSGRPVPFSCRNFLGLRTINNVTVGEQVGFKISVFLRCWAADACDTFEALGSAKTG